jgi:sulfur-oxidizing protein SoxY
MKRRSFVKGTMSASLAGLAVGAGILPTSLLAEDPKAAEKAAPAAAAADTAKAESNFDKGIVASAEASDKIKLKAPDVAENGAVVPITVDASGIEGATAIQIVAMNNPDPLAATFKLAEGTLAFASTRIKMGKTGNVVALVTVGDKTFKTEKSVKVTIGGCGG